MTRRATFTQAELARAVKVADQFGYAVEVTRDKIRLVPHSESAVTSDECDIDKVFGCGT